MGGKSMPDKKERRQINVRLPKITQDMFDEIKETTSWNTSQIIIKGIELTVQWAREERRRGKEFRRGK
jgi:hypothetical protein